MKRLVLYVGKNTQRQLATAGLACLLLILPVILVVSQKEQELQTHAAEGTIYTAGFQTLTGGYDSGNNGMVSATQVTTGPQAGTLQSISIYLGKITAAPKNHFQVALYSDSGSNTPGILLASSQQQVAVTKNWNTFMLGNSVTIAPNTKYWLTFNMDGANTQFAWAKGTGKSVFHFSAPFGSWPSPYGAINTSAAQPYAIYMNYVSTTTSPSLIPTSTSAPVLTATPMPTNVASPTTPPTTSGWPNASNTGVPTGTALTAYSGPCTITAANTVIDAKTVNCGLDIKAANVVIKNSKVNGIVILDTDISGSNQWSFTLQDSEVDGGPIQQAAVSAGNMVVLRSNIHGGQTSVQCEEKSVSCRVQDSWLHGQYIPVNGNWHLGGFLSDGGSNMQLIHNYVVCDRPVNANGEGCTGDINLIPNFATISNVLIQNNLFGANIGSAYCTYGGEKSTSPYPHANNVIYRDNVFQRGTNNKCADYGPVTDFNINGVGNQWINNNWDDGTPVAPAN